MLATLTERRFSDPDWIFEPKLDGERCLAFRRGRRVRLLSRTRQDIGGRYPELVEALEAQDTPDFVGRTVAGDEPSYLPEPVAAPALRARLFLYMSASAWATSCPMVVLDPGSRRAVPTLRETA